MATYNILPLIDTLNKGVLALIAARALDNFYDIEEKAKARASNAHTQNIITSWAKAEWLLSRPLLAEIIATRYSAACAGDAENAAAALAQTSPETSVPSSRSRL